MNLQRPDPVQAESTLEAMPSSPRQASYFVGDMPTIPLSFGYQLALFGVAAAMFVLPLCYLGFIALIGWAIWFWASHMFNVFFPVIGGTRRVFWMLALLYGIPLLAAIPLGLFMLKNFFSRWRVVSFALPISHLEHPEIFRFLGQLCQQMGAPIPSRVDVCLDINASAGFRAGFGSLFGNDIMLTIGLPLVAGMNCRDFAAVTNSLPKSKPRWAPPVFPSLTPRAEFPCPIMRGQRRSTRIRPEWPIWRRKATWNSYSPFIICCSAVWWKLLFNLRST